MGDGDLIAKEESASFVRIVINPELTPKRREALSFELSEKFSDKLIYLYDSPGPGILNCCSILSRARNYNTESLKEELQNHFKQIRGCVIEKNCNPSDQLTFYSPPRYIYLTVAFYHSRSIFEVKGDPQNLGKFLQAYCQSLLKINPSHPTSSLTMNSISPPIPLVMQIERDLWKSSSESTASSEELTLTCAQRSPESTLSTIKSSSEDSDTESETQPPILVVDTPSSPLDQTTTSSQSPKIPETPSDKSLLEQIFEKVKLMDLIPVMKSSIDSMKTSIDQITNRLSNAEEKIAKNSERITTIETNVGRLLTHTVKQTEFDDKISTLESEQKSMRDDIVKLTEKLNSVSSVDAGASKLEDMACKIREDIMNELSKGQNLRNTSRNHHQDLSHLPRDLRGVTTEKGQVINELDHDLLIIGDSNTHPIREDIIRHNTSAAKILAIKHEDAIKGIEDITIRKEPKKILCHSGTNYFSSNVDDRKNDENFESARLAHEDLFKLLEEKFPSSEIYISELFIRGERQMAKYINKYNENICAACRKRGNFRVLRHQESIDDQRRHLRDAKHLSRSGFGEFLKNIRMQMYGWQAKYRSNRHGSYRERR